MFVGTAIGPTLGSFLIRLTHSPLSVFIYASAVHFTFFLYATFIIPESLPSRMRATNKRLIEERKAKIVLEEGVMPRIKRFFAFLRPLGELTPRRVSVEGDGTGMKTRMDWSLTFVTLCYAFSALVIVSRFL